LKVQSLEIKEIFDLVSKEEGHEFQYNEIYNQKRPIRIKNENGEFVDVVGLMIKKGIVIEVKPAGHDAIKIDVSHLIKTDKGLITAADITEEHKLIKTDGSEVKIESIKELFDGEEQIVYSPSVASDSHLYSDSQGFVHHNTYGVLESVKAAGLVKGETYEHVKGKATPMALYRELYHGKDGKLIIFDDCDSVFKNEDAVNILKGALDSTTPREISWKSSRTFRVADCVEGSECYEAQMEEGKYPDVFEFNGKVIFISNIPMAKMDQAIKSRSFTIDITIAAKDIVKRMASLVHNGAFDDKFDRSIQEDALKYLQKVSDKNPDDMGGLLNIRSFLNACKFRSTGKDNWSTLVERYAMSAG